MTIKPHKYKVGATKQGLIMVDASHPPLKVSFPIEISRDAGTGVHYAGTAPPHFERGETGAQVPLHNSIISNVMVYQDQFKTNLLQLFAHT